MAANEPLKFFEQAVKIDPKFALGYSGLADCYNILEGYSWIAPNIARPLAMDSATRALQLDESLAEAHASLGLTLTSNWDFRRAERGTGACYRAKTQLCSRLLLVRTTVTFSKEVR